ncbi:MAG: DUF1566 domain-containing protein [Treponema sp.]|nr:DUF1566 domain-containing protein [Treponema sp.]
MKKSLLVFVGLLAISGGLFAQDLPRLAVVEFSTNVNTEKARADAVTVRNLVESQMVGTRQYQIITRNEIDQLLANQRIQVSEISSTENIQRLQLQNISYIVTGSVDAMGDDYAITVRVLDVSNGRFSHSDSDLMGSSSRDLFNGIGALMARFATAMATDERGAIVQADTLRPSPSGISIQVSTDTGGDLYFQGERVATLWDNDSHTIPIERPGTYSLRLVLVNQLEKTTSVTITTRGVTRVDFATINISYRVGGPGPAGGIIFYDKGNDADGWRFLEAAPASTEFSSIQWGAYNRDVAGTALGIGTGRRNTELIVTRLGELGETGRAAQLCAGLNFGGFSDWFLPSRDELNLMYTNLRQRGLGGFGSDWYWSSSQSSASGAWYRHFGYGSQDYLNKNTTLTVRAVRAF